MSPAHQTLAKPSLMEAWARGKPLDAGGAAFDDAVVRALLVGASKTVPAPGPLILSNAAITGGLSLRAVRVGVGGRPMPWVAFVRCTFSGVIDLRNARLAGLELRDCTAPALLAEGVEVDGALDLGGSCFEGEDHEGAPFAILARGARIGGDLVLSRCQANAPTLLSGARIAGRVLALGAKLQSSNNEWALHAEDAVIEGAVFLQNDPKGRCFQAMGGVNLLGASMSSLTVSRARLTAPVGHAAAFRADGCRVTGGIEIEACRFAGDLSLVGAEADFLRVRRTVLGQGAPAAFAADDLNAKRSVEIAHCCTGDVKLHGLTATTCRLERVRVTGEIGLRGARLGGLSLISLPMRVQARKDGVVTGLDIRGAEIAGRLELRRLTDPEGQEIDGDFRLENARCAVLADDRRECWPAAGHLFLDGFVYDAFRDPPEAGERLAWLKRQVPRAKDMSGRPGSPWSFTRQPYEQLALVLRNHGHAEAADEVALAKRDDEVDLAPLKLGLDRFRDEAGKWVGHGYRWQRMLRLVALWWGVGVTWIWAAVLWGGAGFARVHPDFPRPGRPAAEAPAYHFEGPVAVHYGRIAWGPTPMSKEKGERGCPGVMIPVYALELMVPIADLGQASDCRLESEGVGGGWVQVWRVIYQAIGAFFVAVLGVSLTGFLRKD